MKFIFFVLGVTFLTGLSPYASFGQTYDPIRPPQVAPPSPVAAALFADVNVPVGYYTGTPEINIPLYVIKTGSLQMPVNIKYNAIGIRVEEQSGWTGLHWDLQTGGVISRSKVGIADEADINGGGRQGYRNTAIGLNMPQPGNDLAIGAWMMTLDSCSLQKLAIGRYMELTPDNYYMNFNGNSARLFFDFNAKPYFSPFKAWKLTGTEKTGYKVVIEDGTTYEFMLPEFSSDSSETLPGDGYVPASDGNTSWWLTRVVSADKADTINLNYTSVNYSPTEMNPSESTSILISGQTVPNCVPTPAGQISTKTYGYHYIYGYILKSIVTKEERLDFYASVGRNDIPDAATGMPYKLDSVVDRAILSSGSMSRLKKYVFNYDYYTNSNTGHTTPNSVTQRLRLNSINQLGSSLESGENYQFAYDNSTPLPNKNSMAQDTWGFFNNATGNTTLIPTYTDPWGVTWNGANRNPDPTRAGMGLLNKITYPTGGSTSFEYESNNYATNNPGERDSITISSMYQVSTSNTGNTTPDSATGTLTIPWQQYVTITYGIVEENPKAGDAGVTIYDASNTRIYFNYSIGTASQLIRLDPGVYRLNAFKDPDVNQYAWVRINYQQKVVSPTIGIAAGGSRIKRMVQTDGTTQIIKRFSYLADSITSSGKILNQPIYQDFQYFPQISGCPAQKVGDWNYWAMHSTPTTQLGRTQGSFICYSKVTVQLGDNSENGWEEYFYNFINDFAVGGYPYVPAASLDEFRGQLLKKNVFTSSGKLLQKEENQYNLVSTTGYPNFKRIYGVGVGIRKSNPYFTSGGCPALSQYGWDIQSRTYQIYQLWPTLASTRKAVYSSSTNDSVITLTQMTYDTLNLQTSIKKTWNSKKDSLTDYFTYPHSFTGTAVYDTMIARNIVAPPVEVDHYYNTTLQNKLITNYQLWTFGSLKLPLPLNKQLQFLSNPIETRLQFVNYDAGGNLLSQQKVNDVLNSYIWDYYNHNPIAQVTNAPVSDIAYTSFEFDGSGNWTIASALRDSLNAITGRRSYNLSSGTISKSGLNSAKTYVISYWSKTGSASINGSTTTSPLTKNGWNYYEHSVSGVTSASITGSVTIDELRLYPSDAQMTSYTYLPVTGVSSVCSPSSNISYYEYDGLQRLARVRDMDWNIVKQYEYKYQVTAYTFMNALQTGTFTRNNCSAGFVGTSVIDSVAKGTYGSDASQNAADLIAINDVNANGQNYANLHGSCLAQSESITGSNSSTQSIALAFTNTSTSTVYNFTLNTATSGLALGNIPAGSYNILMTPSAPLSTNWLNYTLNSTTQTNYVAVTFSAITINAASTVSVTSAPCNSTTCTGTNHKCISSVCQTGTLGLISQTYSGGKCTKNYGYFFSDGSYQFDHSVTSTGACAN